MAEFEHSPIPGEASCLISAEASSEGLLVLLRSLLKACRIIGTNLRNCDFSSDAVGTTNQFGDSQLDVDLKADAVVFDCLKESKVVHVASSEENPTEIPCDGQGYSVSFDPLDGSSIVDANFAVGTIIGVWKGDGFLNRTGREQVCSLIVMYGPRITAAVAFNSTITASGTAIALELTLHSLVWVVSNPKLTIKPTAKTFAPGNLRATSDNLQYRGLVNFWIDNKYTLRYSGGLVPDVYHILIKGEGVMTNASSKAAKAKLRLLFECAPIALIIEAAGGASCACPSEAGEALLPVSLLDVPITHLDRRVGVCYGSRSEVDRFKSFLFN